MRRNLEKRIEAYRDDALAAGSRSRLERRLARDADLQRHLRRTDALGSLVNEAWSEGPPAPSPEYVIAALRPALAAADREREAARPLRGFAWLRPAPVALAAVAALLLVVFAPGLSGDDPVRTGAGGARSGGDLVGGTRPAGFGADTFAGIDPLSIYDFSHGETPLMVFEADDGSTVIWLLEGPESDALSQLLWGEDGWA